VGVALVSVLALVTASACSDDSSATPSTSTEPAVIATTGSAQSTTTTLPQGPASTRDGPVVTTDPTDGLGEMAAAGGVLELVGECLFLPDGDASVAVVWPSGTSWDSDTQVVELVDGTRVALGDEIEAGGGYRPGGGLMREVSSLDGRKLAEECARLSGSGSVFVISGGIDVVVPAP
jgi:hypothetical protein